MQGNLYVNITLGTKTLGSYTQVVLVQGLIGWKIFKMYLYVFEVILGHDKLWHISNELANLWQYYKSMVNSVVAASLGILP